MATARDLINSSLRLIGIIAPGEEATPAEFADSLEVLNDFTDALPLERLMLYGNENDTYNLVQNQQAYTIGPSGNFNAERPIAINQAFVTYQGLDFPLKPLTIEQWNEIELKNYSAPLPQAFYYVSTAPLGKIYLWPTPSQAIPITLAVGMQFTALTLDTVLNFPPGYKKFFRYNLAVELASEFGVDVKREVAVEAASLKAAIKRVNSHARFSKLDPALQSGRGYGLADFLGGDV